MLLIPGILRRNGIASLLFLGALISPLQAQVDVEYGEAVNKYGQVALRVATLLEGEHYNDHPIDDEISKELLDNYIEFLDPGRVYFLQSDIDRFKMMYETRLDEALQLGDIHPALDIYDVFKTRLKSRINWVTNLVATEEFTFDSDRKVQISRKDAPYPADKEAADQLWYNMIEGEMLQETLRRENSADEVASVPETDEEGNAVAAEAPLEEEEEELEPAEKIAQRYERVLESLDENTAEDIAGLFLKALSHAYDPHSDYFTQSEYDNFQISMAKSLTGIGALLSMNDAGYAEIRGLVVGGPAHKGGELQVNDRVMAVGQGNGQLQDILHMKLQKVVDLIRGKKGSIVRLKVIPAGAVDPSETRVISIKRDQVDLKESLARAELIETKDGNGRDIRIGWIDLPSFYADMRNGETSVTRDVERLLARLMAEGVEGVVLDLRLNGGGSLEEAINLTGLFIPSGPVVQSWDSRNPPEVKSSRMREPFYKGPLVVLTSKSSASASEILAAALQDYGRAVVVGEESTFGKGTVQQLVPVHTNDFTRLIAPNASQAGALKLTIQKFYRIAGGSTQNLGVVPDIILPSVTDAMDLGEASLKNPLPYDEIPSAKFAPYRKEPLPFQFLKERSEKRRSLSPDFQWIRDETKRFEERKAENTISLNKEKRLKEIDEQEAIAETREEELKKRFALLKAREKGLFTTYSLTLDRVDNPNLKLFKDVTSEELTGMMTGIPAGETEEEQEALTPPHGMGPVKREAINILMDLIAAETRSKPLAITAPTAAPNTGAN